MGGVEIVGFVPGAFPLAVSAMDHYYDTKKAAGTFWSVRRAYRKDYRSVQFCQTMFTPHLEEFLQPLAEMEINGQPDICAELLKDIGGKLWYNTEVEKAFAVRLRNCYQPYKVTIAELQTLMIKLAKETKVEDVQFQQLLEQRTSSAQDSLMQKANTMVRDTAFQARRLKYSISINSREGVLQEVETYVKKLQDLLAAVDRVSKATQDYPGVRPSPVSKVLLHFWRHAERIYRLLRKAMSCSFRSMHCARLWLHHMPERQAQLSLLLLFAKEHGSRPSPWTERALRVEHVGDSTIVPSTSSKSTVPPIALRAISKNAILASSSGITQYTKTTRVSFAAATTSASATQDLSAGGLCGALASVRTACLGALIDEDDQSQYHLFSDTCISARSTEVVKASDVINAGASASPPFYRAYRYSVALKLAAAQLRFHSTLWLQGSWKLSDIIFPKSRAVSGSLDYSSPYLHADFEADAMGQTSSKNRDQSFWTLGVVLLELCFGRFLEKHDLFADPDFARNSKDPFQRQAVAHEWAKDVELEADNDYACAVKWCLQQSPLSGHGTDWRKDFAQSVFQPWQRCFEPLKPGANQT